MQKKLKNKKKITPKTKIIKKASIKKTSLKKDKGKVLVVKKNTKKPAKKKLAEPLIVKSLKLEKSKINPIITPSGYTWESKATFNPTAFEMDGKTHILYRAIGDNDVSVLGYAYSYDGIHIAGRPTYFIYRRTFEKDRTKKKLNYFSGGSSCGGCEDPRVVLIDGTIYMLFTAFDGWGSIRIALTSIKASDFKDRKWNWKKAVMISSPDKINKNWVIFPEKIKGKFAILHSFYPKILINYFKSLDELDGNNFIESDNTRPVDHSRDWDSWFRGVGPSPLKTKYGWLIIYHAMNHRNPDCYRIGALILDSEDPTKILYRTDNPILEPEEGVEKESYQGIVYSCGAIVKNGKLFVYYGGGDREVCVASIKLESLLENIVSGKEVKFKKIKNKK